MKKFLVLVALLATLSDAFCVATAKCLGISNKKLNNDVSVVFIEPEGNDELLILFCMSSGSADEFAQRGVSNILTKIFLKKLQTATKESGGECNSYVGFDQNVYYFFGKVGEVENYLKSFSTVLQDFSASDEDVTEVKNLIEQGLNQAEQSDQKVLRNIARRSLYLHSGYGVNVEGDLRSMKEISARDVNEFKNANYMNSQLTIVIAGKVNQNSVIEMIEKYFVKNNSEKTFVRNRLKEPPHHNFITKLTKKSSQVNVPIIEIYWRIPNYLESPEEALACDIFINVLDKILSKKLIDELGLAASISFKYSFWNREYGDFCMTLTPKEANKIDLLRTAILSEMRFAAHEGISEKDASEAAKKLGESANYFSKNIIDIADIFSKRMSSGYSYEFIRNFAEFSKKYKLETVNEKAKEFFDKDPNVITIITPMRAVGESKNELQM